MQALRGQKIHIKQPLYETIVCVFWGRPVVGDARSLFEVGVTIVRQFNFKAGFNSNGYDGEANRMTRFQHIRRSVVCRMFAGSVQYICRPGALPLQDAATYSQCLCSILAGPVQRMQAQSSQCQCQGKNIPWHQKPANYFSGKVRSHLGALAPKASKQFQRQGKITPWRPATAAGSSIKVTSYIGASRQQPMPAPR